MPVSVYPSGRNTSKWFLTGSEQLESTVFMNLRGQKMHNKNIRQTGKYKVLTFNNIFS